MTANRKKGERLTGMELKDDQEPFAGLIVDRMEQESFETAECPSAERKAG